MRLDFSLKKVMPVYVFESNMTHNMTPMATAAGVYDCLWHPEIYGFNGVTRAKDLIEPLQAGVRNMVLNAEELKKLNPTNGWGNYESFLEFVRECRDACLLNPGAVVEVSR